MVVCLAQADFMWPVCDFTNYAPLRDIHPSVPKCTLYPLHAQTGQSKQFMRHNWMLITKQAVLGPLECKWQDRDFKSNCCWLKCSEQAHFHTKHNTQKGWNGIMSDIQHTDPANNYGRSTEIPMLESQGQDNPFRWHSLLQLLFKIPSKLLLNNCSSSAKRHCESKKTAGLDFLKYFPVELRHISAYLQLFARAGRWW